MTPHRTHALTPGADVVKRGRAGLPVPASSREIRRERERNARRAPKRVRNQRGEHYAQEIVLRAERRLGGCCGGHHGKRKADHKSPPPGLFLPDARRLRYLQEGVQSGAHLFLRMEDTLPDTTACHAKRYLTKAEAKRALAHIQTRFRGSTPRYAYHCRCGWWHVSSSQTRSPIKHKFTYQGEAA
jgi:hypothetical protein